jgi:oligosaccharide reducing-end xylanase
MPLLRLIPLFCGLAVTVCATPAQIPAPVLASGQYRNLFCELLGKTDAEIDAKLAAAWQQIFYGDPDTQRLYYPIADDLAYLPDVGNRDVRTEGMSYGMMIAVQLDHQKEFNALWKFAKRFMYRDRGPLRGYFTWHTAYDGSMARADGSIVRGAGPAPDGEEWFTMALFFAAHRWGNGEGIFNYAAEAQGLLHTMMHKDEEADRGAVTTMFDRTARQVRFVPEGPGANITDASYHLPAFYELWARWAAAPEDRAFLAGVAKTSREFLKKVAHPKTGLMPNYSAFDGAAVSRRGFDEFREDAWRTLSNVALDYSWWAADPWEAEQSNRVLTFFAAQPPDNWPVHLKLDGTPTQAGGPAAGLHAMAAAAGLAADPAIARPFVQHLWEMKIPDDTGRNHDGVPQPGELRSWRYYDGLLTMLAWLEVSGHFRIYAPASAP